MAILLLALGESELAAPFGDTDARGLTASAAFIVLEEAAAMGGGANSSESTSEGYNPPHLSATQARLLGAPGPPPPQPSSFTPPPQRQQSSSRSKQAVSTTQPPPLRKQSSFNVATLGRPSKKAPAPLEEHLSGTTEAVSASPDLAAPTSSFTNSESQSPPVQSRKKGVEQASVQAPSATHIQTPTATHTEYSH